MIATDPTGKTVVGATVGIAIGDGVAGKMQIGLAIDDEGNLALFRTTGAGAGGGASLGPAFVISTADTVDSLAGESISLSGIAGGVTLSEEEDGTLIVTVEVGEPGPGGFLTLDNTKIDLKGRPSLGGTSIPQAFEDFGRAVGDLTADPVGFLADVFCPTRVCGPRDPEPAVPRPVGSWYRE